MNKRRHGAPYDGAGAGSSKKRRTETTTKYYAVRRGYIPGIYMDYAECQQQTTGFKGSICEQQTSTSTETIQALIALRTVKSFKTRQEAQDFIDGKEAPGIDGPEKFYAVAVGRPPGIYPTWPQCQEAIAGVPGQRYKKFNTREQAEDFIREEGTRETCKALGIRDGRGGKQQQQPLPQSQPRPRPTRQSRPQQEYTPALFELNESSSNIFGNVFKPEPQVEAEGEDIIKIYTDGSSLANGQAGAAAGLGVFFGPRDERNLSERLPGEPQTNQRAELMAMLRALEIVPLTQGVQILSDSQYSINCITQWGPSWKKNGWKTATGGIVKNQDIVRDLLAKRDQRNQAGAVTDFKWVKGHANDAGNIAADHLANIGSRMPKV
ncbi:hypothetical protein F66182_2591 [Fusarium sp. NRRL 66182]|nr:hypothetical protein F66182_2591 [Fusarium sp. NRRL 66182]